MKHFSIRQKILALSALVATPFIVVIIYLLFKTTSYNNTYHELVKSMTVANSYNISFKENMDESLYKLVVGYVSFETISEEEGIRNPYDMLTELRQAFTTLRDNNTVPEGRLWADTLLRNVDALEKCVDEIHESIDQGETYDKNIEKLDNDIYILTELIQEDIQYYIYHQTKGMETVTENVRRQAENTILVCAVVSIVLFFIVVIFVVILVGNILTPVEKLTKATEKIAQGDFSVRAEVDTDDEITVLASSFNHMASSMEELIDEIKQDEQKMRQADLRLLQEQINPHFLYNTLDTIVWLIEGGEEDQAVEMVITLSNFFRLTLSKGKEHISIREEAEHIDSYLKIQQVRYHDVMEYDISIDDVVLDNQILKLTLQPIVENALYHGLKPKRAKGYIHITGEKEGDTIRLSVRDDGVGMSNEELVDLRAAINKPCKETNRGFGLANVNERIRMYFGNEYGMDIQSEEGKGTIITITIPARKVEADERKN